MMDHLALAIQEYELCTYEVLTTTRWGCFLYIIHKSERPTTGLRILYLIPGAQVAMRRSYFDRLYVYAIVLMCEKRLVTGPDF